MEIIWTRSRQKLFSDYKTTMVARSGNILEEVR
jgi:hypothetical protein